jgi:hypothetical protein
LLQDWDVRVGIVPQSEEIQMCGATFLPPTSRRPIEIEMRERPEK